MMEIRTRKRARIQMDPTTLNGNEPTCPPLAEELFSAMDEACMHSAVLPRDEEDGSP